MKEARTALSQGLLFTWEALVEPQQSRESRTVSEPGQVGRVYNRLIAKHCEPSTPVQQALAPAYVADAGAAVAKLAVPAQTLGRCN